MDISPVEQASGRNYQDRAVRERSAPGFLEDRPSQLAPPDAAETEAKVLLSRRIKLFVEHIRISGNTVFSLQELAPLTAAYENQEIDTLQLQQLRQDITRFYVDRGYINSGAVIPDQDVVDGTVEIRIIEGRLSRVDIDGNRHLRTAYLRPRIALAPDQPLALQRLQERIQLLLENPLIERVNASLQPGTAPGEAVLHTQITEQIPYQLGLVFDNQIAPSIGGYQGTAYAAHRSLLGFGDTFSAQGRFAEGLTSYGLDYWLPVTTRDTTLHAWYADYAANIVETPFNIIDVESRSAIFGISAYQPFYRHPARTVAGSVTLERRRSQTFLLGQPFPFSPGVSADGESSVTVLRIGQEWTERAVNQVFAARSTFNVGLDLLDATINRDAPDGRFFSWVGQVQWARRFDNAQLIFRTDLQVASDSLLPLEKFQIGGASSVRGYRENQIVRDYGFAASLEYRHPLLSDTLGAGKLFLAPFIDVGGAWDVKQLAEDRNPDVLASLGLGLVWEPHRLFHAHVYWGHPLVRVDNPYSDPQDFGFHFKLAGQLF